MIKTAFWMECDDCGTPLISDFGEVTYTAGEGGLRMSARRHDWNLLDQEDLCPDCKEHR